MEKTNVIIGGGIAGLSVAYELTKKGESALIVEKEGCLGGLLSSVKRNDYHIERYYHHIFENFDNTIRLLKELKLDHRLVTKPASTGFYDERLYRLSSPLDVLFFSPLNFVDKLGLARIVLKIKGADPSKFDNVPVKEWIVKNSSEKIFEKFFRPLLLSKYADNSNISASWFIERMKLRNKRSMGGEKLIYLRGGFELMIKELEKRILDNGGEISLSSQIDTVETDRKRIKNMRVSSEKIKVDNLISTINPDSLEKLVKGFKAPKLKYQGAACVLMAMKKKVHPYYWTNLIKPQLKFGAIIEHTNFMPLEDYNGEHLVYLASYPKEDSLIWKQTEKDVFESYFSDLKKIFPVNKQDVLKYWVFRNKESGLVFERGTAKKILPCRTRFENLFIGGMFNSYPERSSDESIRLGKECAKLALGG